MLFIKGIFNWLYGVENLSDFFDKQNLKLKVINYETDSLEITAKKIFKKIKPIIQSENVTSLIGYSYGGLIILKIIQDHPEIQDKFKKILLIGCPINYSLVSKLTLLNILKPNITAEISDINNFLSSTNSLKFNRFIIISGTQDFIVPTKNCHFNKIKSLKLNGVGHIGLIEKEKAFKAIYSQIIS